MRLPARSWALWHERHACRKTGVDVGMRYLMPPTTPVGSPRTEAPWGTFLQSIRVKLTTGFDN